MRCQGGVKEVSRRCQAGDVCCHALQEVLKGCLKGAEWPPQRDCMAVSKVLNDRPIGAEWPPHRYWMAVSFVLDGDASGRGWGMWCFLVIDDGYR